MGGSFAYEQKKRGWQTDFRELLEQQVKKEKKKEEKGNAAVPD